MQSSATSAADYIAEMPVERQAAFKKLRAAIKKNLSSGFQESMGYGMLGYSVPHSKDPLPFMGIASQKNFIAVYHMGIYASPELLKWFTAAHAKASPKKLDMGKSCIRYKKPEDIPIDLIGELAGKMSADEWISLYEEKLKR
jgi:hypothetical protein